jgi:predicted nucleic acid-binding protein
MEALNVEIVNPKAKVLLENLESIGLIHIKPEVSLSEMLARLRRNELDIPSEEDIAKEVELVRQYRYEKKIQDNY